MDILFMDSSAIIKRYVSENGSPWVRGLFLAVPANRVTVASITSVEVVAAVTRRSRGGTISSADAAAACALFLLDYASDLGVIEVTDVLLSQAVHLAQSYGLRGYDAVQLAAGVELERLRAEAGLMPVIFITTTKKTAMADVGGFQCRVSLVPQPFVLFRV